MYYDYVLSLHWEKYTYQELQDFTRSMYAVLSRMPRYCPSCFNAGLS
ncbi:MAG: DUF479 domain-containing protein [Saprospiraceae bacterium]|nr:DUF479 domain-containing protein [Saprospiraceae bacterium]